MLTLSVCSFTFFDDSVTYFLHVYSIAEFEVKFQGFYKGPETRLLLIKTTKQINHDRTGMTVLIV